MIINENNEFITDDNVRQVFWKWIAVNKNPFLTVIFFVVTILLWIWSGHPNIGRATPYIQAFFGILTLWTGRMNYRAWKKKIGRSIDLRGGKIAIKIINSDESVWYKGKEDHVYIGTKFTSNHYNSNNGVIKKRHATIIKEG